MKSPDFRSVQIDRDKEPRAFALDEQRHALARFGNDAAQLIRGRYRLPVDREDDIAATDACPRRRALGVFNQQAAAQFELPALLAAQRARRHAQAAGRVGGIIGARAG